MRPALGTTEERSAEISACGRYRYALRRTWTAGAAVLWVMLNPSTADGESDDPTLRRVRGFSIAWGFGSLRVVNLFALRATDPGELVRAQRRGDETCGPEADSWIRREAEGVGLVVAGWGDHGLRWPNRAASVLSLISQVCPAPVRCLGATKHGAPRHPLRLPAGTLLEPFPAGGA